MNRVWDNELRAKVMQSQYDALGISVERDYMRDLLKQNLTSFEEFKNEACNLNINIASILFEI